MIKSFFTLFYFFHPFFTLFWCSFWQLNDAVTHQNLIDIAYTYYETVFLGVVYCGFAGIKYLNISVMATFRELSNKIKVVRNCLFHIHVMKWFLRTSERKNYCSKSCQNKKMSSSNNKITFFHILFKWHHFKSAWKKLPLYILKGIIIYLLARPG